MSEPIKYVMSAGALIAARTLWKNLEFRERRESKLAADVENVARIIDVHTQLFRLEAALNEVVQRVQWVSKERLAEEVDLARDALRILEKVRQKLPVMEESRGASAPACSAAVALFEHFDIYHRPKSRIRLPRDPRASPTHMNVAREIDASTGVFRIEATIDIHVSGALCIPKDDVRRHLQLLRETVRQVELIRNRTPKFKSNPIGVVHREPEIDRPKITPEQRRYLGHIKKALEDSGTAEEYQRVLRRAGLITA